MVDDHGKPRLEVEIHVGQSSSLENASEMTSSRGVRVTHIVVRLDVLRLQLEDLTYIDTIASIQEPSASLSCLRTVTVETTDEAENAEVVEKLPMLDHSGKLRRRTCKEAQTVAQEALQCPGYSEEWGIVSPLWYLNEYEDWQRNQWCADLSPVLIF